MKNSNQKPAFKFPVSKEKLTSSLALFVVGLHILNAFAVWFRYANKVDSPFINAFFIPFFQVSSEGTLPTYYSTLTLLFSSVLLAMISVSEFKRRNSFWPLWTALSAIFLFMSADELLSIHERMTVPVRMALNTTGIFYFAWVIPAMVFVVVLCLSYCRFLLRLPFKERALLILAGAVYLGGVLGMEMVGSYYQYHHGATLTYGVLASIEEVFEMTGILIFIYALLYHLESNQAPIANAYKFTVQLRPESSTDLKVSRVRVRVTDS